MHNPYQHVGALYADRLNSIIRTNSTLPSKRRFSSFSRKVTREEIDFIQLAVCPGHSQGRPTRPAYFADTWAETRNFPSVAIDCQSQVFGKAHLSDTSD